MAKNVTKLNSARASVLAESGEQTYSGTFVGNLKGNADTASLLENSFTITITGDGTGKVSTRGESAQLSLKVNKAATADQAKYAESAGTVASAATAQTAAFATTAGTANEAGHATAAENANYATASETANHANTADKAVYAERAAVADKVTLADEATTAKEAEHAVVADRLSNTTDYAVPHAKFADKASLAVMAQYDCMGRSFTNYYALKSELEPYENMVTYPEGKHLFLTREEKITQAVVRGKAWGSGVVHGNTLELQIQCLAGGGNGYSLYDDILFRPEFPEVTDRDTTKAYINSDGYMAFWDNDNQTWLTVKGELSQETVDNIDGVIENIQSMSDYIEKVLKNAVTIDGAQTIEGPKTFIQHIISPIPDLWTDPGRYVATVHNVRDVRDGAKAALAETASKLTDMIYELTDRVDQQEFGDVLFADKDYTLEVNQGYMAEHTTYIMYLDENKQYIQLDPDTWMPVDPDAKIVWMRRIAKDHHTGKVYYYDIRMSVDPEQFVPWTISDSGKKNIVLDQTCQLKSKNSVGELKNLINLSKNDTVQIGTQETACNIQTSTGHITVNGKDILATNVDLDKYMPKTGGEFTGSISVPDLALSTDDSQVLNSHCVRELIISAIKKYDNAINLTKYMLRAGGDFTGVVRVPDSIDLDAAQPTELVNLGDIKKLLEKNNEQTGFLKLVNLDAYPVCDEMEENVLYAVPLATDRPDFAEDGEIYSIRVEPDDSNSEPDEGEGVVYVSPDIL